jgi:hypothetical protein
MPCNNQLEATKIENLLRSCVCIVYIPLELNDNDHAHLKLEHRSRLCSLVAACYYVRARGRIKESMRVDEDKGHNPLEPDHPSQRLEVPGSDV